MNEYRLSFEAASPLSIEELSEGFYEHFDGVLVERAGQIIVTVYVEGPTAIDAAHAAIDKLERLNVSVCHVDSDLVDASEIASRLGVTRQAVQLWATGKRGKGFPRPVGSPGGKRIWTWGEVVAWARANQHSDEASGLSRDELTIVNAHLAERRRRASSPSWEVKPGHSKAQAGVRGIEDYHQSPVPVKASL
ncbi:helix-turn-helix transcriptional regulator [Nocardioides limicola]|uniref:helix-turn-helix transcriptional regulator n=1 Tax=Nocardioides limicola TaxID=2803368 RepID=UPI00193B908A|nr:hypothetical protein [Nocardioides sp. DJM-14]